jgi:hypothetical protein
MWVFTSPGSSGSNRSTQPVPRSDGYLEFLSLAKRAFDGDLPVIRPAAWSNMMDRVVSHFGDANQAQAYLARATRRHWGLSASTLATRFECRRRGAIIDDELLQRAGQRDITPRLAVLATIRLEDLPFVNLPDEGGQGRLSLTLSRSSSIEASPLHEELRQIAISERLPPGVARLYCAGANFKAVAVTLQIARSDAKRLAACLSDELLARLRASRSWSKTSWLERELADRKQRRRQRGPSKAPQ